MAGVNDPRVPRFYSIARDVPLRLISDEHLISALRRSESFIEYQRPCRLVEGQRPLKPSARVRFSPRVPIQDLINDREVNDYVKQ